MADIEQADHLERGGQPVAQDGLHKQPHNTHVGPHIESLGAQGP
jgi:hypothetical protein